MKNLRQKLIQLLGTKKGKKLYHYYYYHNGRKAKDVADVQVHMLGKKQFITFYFINGETWEIEFK